VKSSLGENPGVDLVTHDSPPVFETYVLEARPPSFPNTYMIFGSDGHTANSTLKRPAGKPGLVTPISIHDPLSPVEDLKSEFALEA
jgi:hypothetical protein